MTETERLFSGFMHQFWQKFHFSSNHTSNKFPPCPGFCLSLNLPPVGAAPALTPAPTLPEVQSSEAGRSTGRCEACEGFRASFSGHIRPPTPELGMGHMGQAGIKTCCLYICLIFLSSVILLTSFTIQWILYSIQFSLVSHIAFDFIKINGGNSRKGLVSWALLKGG